MLAPFLIYLWIFISCFIYVHASKFSLCDDISVKKDCSDNEKCYLEDNGDVHGTPFPSIQLLAPLNYDILVTNNDIYIKLRIYGFKIPDDGYLYLFDQKWNSTDNIIFNIASPGNLVLKLVLVTHEDNQIFSCYVSYVFVLPEREIQSIPLLPINKQIVSETLIPQEELPKICFISGFDLHESQEHNWIEQIKILSKKGFQFEHITLSASSAYFSKFLKELNIPSKELQLKLSIQTIEFFQINAKNIFFLLYKSLQNLEFNGLQLDKITPLWCRSIWKDLIEMLESIHIDILVLSLSKGYDSEYEVILKAARLAGIKNIISDMVTTLPLNNLNDILIVPSSYHKEKLKIKSSFNISSSIVTIFPLSVNISLFNFKNRITTKKFIIGFATNSENEGHFIYLFHVISLLHKQMQVSSLNFLIIAKENILQKLKSFVTHFCLETALIEFREWQIDHLQKYIQDIDIFLNPSQEYTFSIPYHYAMAYAIPIVGFALDGTNEYLIDQWNGIIVKNSTPNAFLHEILNLVYNPYLIKTLGWNGYKLIKERFRIDMQINQYERLYLYLISKKPLIALVSPENFFLTTQSTIHLFVSIKNFILPKDGFLLLDLDDGKSTIELQETSQSFNITIKEGDPGTHHLKILLLTWQRNTVAQFSFFYELTLSNRVLESQIYGSTLMDSSFLPKLSFHPHLERKIRICFYGGLAQFDGQTKIWSDQIRFLSRDIFSFSYISTDSDSLPTVNQHFQLLNISVFHYPLTLSKEEAEKNNITRENGIEVLIYSLQQVNRSIERIVSPWIRETWLNLVSLFTSAAPDIVVFSSSRDAKNLIIIEAAKLAHVQLFVMELTNIYPYYVPVNLIISPSHYAKYHASVQKLYNPEMIYIISPGTNASYSANTNPNCSVLHEPRSASKTYGSSSSNGAVPYCSLKEKKSNILGFAGRLSSEKSIGLLLRALAVVKQEIPNVSLIIIGDGPAKTHILALIQSLKLQEQVILRGWISKEIHLHFEEMNIFVSSSLIGETFCIANIEAMASGLPLVTFGVGGIHEYLQDGVNGLRVKIASVEALSESILYLLRNPEIAKEMGKNAKKLIKEKFKIDIQMKKYSFIYQKLFFQLNRTRSDFSLAFS